MLISDHKAVGSSWIVSLNTLQATTMHQDRSDGAWPCRLLLISAGVSSDLLSCSHKMTKWWLIVSGDSSLVQTWKRRKFCWRQQRDFPLPDWDWYLTKLLTETNTPTFSLSLGVISSISQTKLFRLVLNLYLVLKVKRTGWFTGWYFLLQVEALINTVSPLVITP